MRAAVHAHAANKVAGEAKSIVHVGPVVRPQAESPTHLVNETPHKTDPAPLGFDLDKTHAVCR